MLFAVLLSLPILARAAGEGTSVITATDQAVPIDDHLPEEYRFPENNLPSGSADGEAFHRWNLCKRLPPCKIYMK